MGKRTHGSPDLRRRCGCLAFLTTHYTELFVWRFVAPIPFDAVPRIAVCNGFGPKITACDDVIASARSLLSVELC
jgi:hypothetical protein